MNAFTVLIYVILFIVGAGITIQLYARGSRVGLLLMFAFWVRVIVACVLDSGLKYDFVLDSLGYERNSWLLAQSWMTPDREFYSLADGFMGRNLYELLLAGVFYVFGKEALLAEFINIGISVSTFGLIYLMQKKLFAASERAAVISLFLLAIYPSSMVWAATNIRDPLYFFFCILFLYLLLHAFLPQSNWPPVARVAALFGVAACFVAIVELRNYVAWLFVGGLVLGVALAVAVQAVSIRVAVLSALAIAIVGGFLWQMVAPDDVAGFLLSVQKVRQSFSNFGEDSFARSSFALDYNFNSMSDFVLFVPYGLIHYFLAPFPWEVSSTIQALSMIEVFGVYVLIWPTWIGLRRAYNLARFGTVVLFTFVIIVAAAQAVSISNSGTIFRHRTLGFFILLIFTGIGLNEIWKKNTETVLKA